MLTINNEANAKIMKAIRAMDEAVIILTQLPEYSDKRAIFHNSTVHDVNRLITAIQTLND